MAMNPCEAIKDLRLLVAQLKAIKPTQVESVLLSQTLGDPLNTLFPMIHTNPISEFAGILSQMEKVFEEVNPSLPAIFQK